LNAEGHFLETNVHAVSCFAAADLSVEEIAKVAYEQGRLAHGQITTSTIGALRAAGFQPMEAPVDDPHVDIYLGEHPADDSTWARLAELFDDPQPNPALAHSNDLSAE
jgi:hypothetical protein